MNLYVHHQLNLKVKNYSFTNFQVQKTKIIAVISIDGYARVIINPKTIQY